MMNVLAATYGFLMGAATGSFSGVIIERVPAGQSIGGRSHCVCGAKIPGWRNIPIFTWLAQRGRAACCDAPIPSWYVKIEALYATIGLFAGLLFGWAGVIASFPVWATLTWVSVRRAKAS